MLKIAFLSKNVFVCLYDISVNKSAFILHSQVMLFKLINFNIQQTLILCLILTDLYLLNNIDRFEFSSTDVKNIKGQSLPNKLFEH